MWGDLPYQNSYSENVSKKFEEHCKKFSNP